MTLPFEPSSNVRQYICFVCGRGFKEFDEFKSHIVDNHEEGREYVLCPLDRCKAPVRDVRSHFKIKHPKEQVPKVGQMKALIWHDVINPNKVKKKKPTFREGYFISEKNGNRPMHYRSGYESSVYESLEKLNEVVSYEVEPFHVNYWFQGQSKSYYPDLMVQFTDGRIEVWEIKPKQQTTLAINDAKWTAVNNYCLSKGWEFKVYTEQGINKLKKGIIL